MDLVHPKEKIYFALSLIISLGVYAVLGLLLMKQAEAFLGVIFYVLIGLLAAGIVQGLFIGHIRGNAIRVSPSQFPEVYRSAQKFSQAMGLSMPAVYVLQAGGLLNAFATRFLGRNFVIIYSDVLELAYERGEAELDFVVCHELAHLKRRHLTWRKLLFPSNLIPWLALAYSRACEYTCDRFGAHYVPNGAVGGVCVLAAGKKLYRNVNVAAFAQQAITDRGFWTRYAEIYSTHPHMTKRVAEVQRLTVGRVTGAATASAT